MVSYKFDENVLEILKSERPLFHKMTEKLKEELDDEILHKIVGEFVNKTVSEGDWENEPEKIERSSFGRIYRFISNIPEKHRYMIAKLIHSVGDFTILPDIEFSENFLKSSLNVLSRGGRIICDSRMSLSAIYSNSLNNNEKKCVLDIPGIQEVSRKHGITKSAAGILLTSDNEFRNTIYCVGNSPTALMEILKIADERGEYPGAVAGFPVGFVNAAYSKKKLSSSGIPFITVHGNRGGSPLASACMNSLGVMLLRQEKYIL
ncbi:precorrin-8X methylmutase [Caldiplasma sukawensis]